MRFGIIGNLSKPGLADAVSLLLRSLHRAGSEFVIDDRIVPLLNPDTVGGLAGCRKPLKECVSKVDMVIALGGDGTILWGAREVGSLGTPILGVNLGKLGFLAELSPDDMQRAINDILANKYIIEERLVLEAESPNIAGKVLHAYNDIVVGKARSSRVIDLETHIDGSFAVTYRGDGLIVSTPTGSTAYALSNGGPIVIPTSNVIGITPIAPHTLSGRPLIVPETSTIRIAVSAEDDEILISADGQEEAFVQVPVEVVIRRAPFRLRLVKRVDRSYFDVLRAKLLWGKDARVM
jgi:NAD+ kinase